LIFSLNNKPGAELGEYFRLYILREMGECGMNIYHNNETDLLYFRLDDRAQDVMNRRIALKNLFPIEYETAKT
jgi:hypothetical protein